MSWRVSFWLGALLWVALTPLVVLLKGGTDVPQDWVRALAISQAAGVALLAVVPGLLYQHRYITAPTSRRRRMLGPSDVWGMAGSYIAVLVTLAAVTAGERWGRDVFPSLSAALLISEVLCWRWLYRLVGRQLAFIPEPMRKVER